MNTVVQNNRKKPNVDPEPQIELKEKISQYGKKISEDKKLIKQQLNVIIALDDKYKQLCQKVGLTINPLLDQIKMNDFYKRKSYDISDEVDKQNKLFNFDDSSDEDDFSSPKVSIYMLNL